MKVIQKIIPIKRGVKIIEKARKGLHLKTKMMKYYLKFKMIIKI